MERVTRAEAARTLGVSKGTVWNWVNKHPALLGDDGLIDLVELRSHRDQVANPALQTRLKAKPVSDPAARAGGPVLNDHRARGEAAKAITAELDLADRLKLTLSRADVESQIGQAGEILKRKAAELAKDRAEALARIDDPRTMERALDDLMRQLLEQGALALTLAMSDRETGDREQATDAA
jgi:hypothetical protein